MRRYSPEKKVAVITGIGIISPIGIGAENFWSGLLAGKSGVSTISHFDASSFPFPVAAEVKDFKGEDFLSKRQCKFYGKASQFAVAAAKLALKDAELDYLDTKNTDVLLGCAVGSFDALEKAVMASGDNLVQYEEDAFNMMTVLQSMTYSPASAIALETKAEGYVSTISSSCVSGINAIGLATERIQEGKAKFVFTGGVDTPINRIVMSALSGSNMIPDKFSSPEDILCPFDKRRTRSAVGEGAGIFIIEELEHALARKAKIYASIDGFAQGAENINELFLADKTTKSWQKIIKRAIVNAKLKLKFSEAIDYINAHAPSDKYLDRIESQVITNIFNSPDNAVSTSSIKGATGSPFSAAGAFQVAATGMAIHDKIIPPNYNYNIPDPECDLQIIREKTLAPKLKTALVNGHGLGGLNSALILKEVKYDRI